MKNSDFDKLYEKHAEQVYRFLLRLCQDTHLAQDLTQDTFLKAMENIDTFDNRCKFSTWLCQIAKNAFYDHRRKVGRHSEEELPEDDSLVSDESMEDDVLDRQAAQEIRKCIHRLPEPYKEVFLLRFYGDLIYREIGEIFGKSEVWARVTYLRGREMLKERLKGRRP